MSRIGMVVALALVMSLPVVAQEYARDLVPTAVVFHGEEGGIVEYDIEYSVLTAFADGAHSTSIQVLVNGVPHETIPVTIDPYDGGKGRPGSCWLGSGTCPSRGCFPDTIKCVLVKPPILPDYCSCDILGAILSLEVPLEMDDVVTVVMDPEDSVPENIEDDNTLSVVYAPAIPAVSEWGLVLMTLLVITTGTACFRRRRAPTPTA